MPHVITKPCVGVKDGSCVDVCPVDCIHSDEDSEQFYIDADTCIDCGLCVDECPVNAIYSDEDLPSNLETYIQINLDYFKNKK
tara:strand:+ start:404 stop:652 length:249 start_codon:yes stop_codon:yes gene_type:complete